MAEIILYIIIFLYGIVLGSFLNVLIYRIPNRENFTLERSHCMKCGQQIKWYDLVPLFSYVILGGRCRNCGERISLQYPIVEAVNGIAYVLIFLYSGISYTGVLYCLMFSIFITISVIDFRTYEIPAGLNVVILVLAVIRLALETEHIWDRLAGFAAVSGFMLICLIVGRKLKGVDAFGGGDIKLMAAAGLFMGVKESALGFIIGCILGAVIHSIRMKVSGEEHILAFGPYLCAGLFVSMLFGDMIIDWYLSFAL